MSLQISEWCYGGDDPELIGNTGHMIVAGPGVDAKFDYAGYRGITREQAFRQAQFFADAMSAGVFDIEGDLGAVIEADFLKAVRA